MITKDRYEFALARIEELLPIVDDNTPANDPNAVELTMMSNLVIDYEMTTIPWGNFKGKKYNYGHAEVCSLVTFTR